MRALFEIIEAIKDGERPGYDELRYALLTTDCILTDVEQFVLMDLCGEIISEHEAYASLGTVEELSELVKAKRDGRCVVLPCKCGECEKYKSVSPKCGNCNRTTVIQHPEDYCNHGIRRENNEN